MFKRLLVSFLFCFNVYSFAQLNSIVSKDTPLIFSKELLAGELKNKAHYYIQPDTLAKSIEISLVLKVGSGNEQKGEEGASHYIEHLAFHGSKNFPGNSLYQFDKLLGGKLGMTLAAYTGYDRTVYRMSIPNEKYLPKALAMFKEIVGQLTFKKSDVEDERGIIKEECAQNNADERIEKFKNGEGTTLQHLPIGTQEEIDALTYPILKKYYKKHYLASNTGIVIVGKVNPSFAINQVRQIFNQIPSSRSFTPPIERLDYKEELHYWSQKNTTNRSEIEWLVPVHHAPDKTYGDILRKYQRDFILQRLNTKLKIDNYSTNIEYNWRLFDTYQYRLYLYSDDHHTLKEDFKTALSIFNHFRVTGLTEEELKDSLPKFLEKLSDDEHYTLEDQQLHLEEYFLLGSISKENKEEKLWVKNELQKMPLASWNQVIKDIFKVSSSRLLIYYYKGDQPVYTQSDFENWILAVEKENGKLDLRIKEKLSSLTSKQSEKNTIKTPKLLQSLAKVPYKVALIEKVINFPANNMREVKLKNGIRILLKKTKDTDSPIYISMHNEAGFDSVPEGDYYKFYDTESFLYDAGIQGIHSEELSNYLYQNSISYSPYIDNHWSGVFAASPKDKLKETLSLLYLYSTQPALDYTYFEQYKKNLTDKFKTKKKIISNDRLELAKSKGLILKTLLSDQREPENSEEVASLSLDAMLQFHIDLFSNASTKSFIVTGPMELDDMERAVVEVAAMFKSETPKKSFGRTVTTVKIPREKSFGNPKEDRVDFDVLYTFNEALTFKELIGTKLIRELLDDYLFAVLREKYALVYVYSLTSSYTNDVQPVMTYEITGNTSKSNVETLEKAIDEAINTFKTQPLDPKKFEGAKKYLMKLTDTPYTTENPFYWRAYLDTLVKQSYDIEDLVNQEKIIENFTEKDLKAILNKTIDSQRKYILLNYE